MYEMLTLNSRFNSSYNESASTWYSGETTNKTFWFLYFDILCFNNKKSNLPNEIFSSLIIKWIISEKNIKNMSLFVFFVFFLYFFCIFKLFIFLFYSTFKIGHSLNFNLKFMFYCFVKSRNLNQFKIIAIYLKIW